MTKLGVKVKFGKQCRRFRISQDMKLSEFQGRLEALFSAKLFNTTTKYLDIDEDWVNIDTEEEFTEAKLLTLDTQEKCLRLDISRTVDIKNDKKKNDLEKFIINAIENSGNVVSVEKLKEIYKNVEKEITEENLGIKEQLSNFIKEIGALFAELTISSSSSEISNQMKQEFTVDINKSNGKFDVYKGVPKSKNNVGPSVVVKPKPKPKVMGATQVGEGGINAKDEVEQETVFKKIWKVKNTGDCDWKKGTHLKFIGGSEDLKIPMNSKFQIPKPACVGETVDIVLELTAPKEPITYSAYFSLSDNEKLFGQKLLLELNVVENKALKKWAEKLKFLAEMGFVDAKKLIVLLEKNNGDLPSTIQDYLSQN